jgi:hypothetical protein
MGTLIDSLSSDDSSPDESDEERPELGDLLSGRLADFDVDSVAECVSTESGEE